MKHVSILGWGAWRVGWPDRIEPPTKRGRWWTLDRPVANRQARLDMVT